MCFNLESLVIFGSVHNPGEPTQYGFSAVKDTYEHVIVCVRAGAYQCVDDWVITSIKGLDVLVSLGGISHVIEASEVSVALLRGHHRTYQMLRCKRCRCNLGTCRSCGHDRVPIVWCTYRSWDIHHHWGLGDVVLIVCGLLLVCSSNICKYSFYLLP